MRTIAASAPPLTKLPSEPTLALGWSRRWRVTLALLLSMIGPAAVRGWSLMALPCPVVFQEAYARLAQRDFF